MVHARSYGQVLQELKQRFFKHQRPILWGLAAVSLAAVVAVALLFATLPGRNELRTLGRGVRSY